MGVAGAVAGTIKKIKLKHVLYALYIIAVLVLITIVTWGLAGADCCTNDTRGNQVYCKVHGGHPAGSVGWSLLLLIVVGSLPVIKHLMKSKLD